MKLIVMLLVVLWRQRRPPGALAWPARWNPVMDDTGGALRWLPAAGVPAVLVALLLWLGGAWLWGSVGLVIGLAVLANCLGGTDWRPTLAALAEDSGRGDLQGALHRLDDLADHETAGEIQDPAGLRAATREKLALRFLREWFAVLFWFALLGAPGALAYRCLERVATSSAGAARLLAWLEWPALRAFGFVVVLSGHPGRGMGVWAESLLTGTNAARVAGAYVEAAFEPLPEGLTPEAGLATQVRALDEIFRRAVLGWLVVAALLLVIF
ncbi:MAG: cobalamin biosynthesis protein [Gammaproteobacteria bacterium]|nr:cobalamin biosynthesis protein [Gammaproteobacteria bacterium]